MEHRNGIWFGISAYIVWGLSPLFWKLVDGVSTLDLLIHRTLWAVPLLAVVITAVRGWPSLRAAYRDRRRRMTTVVAAALLGTNWGVFLWGVTHDQVLEVSLGYFINPLVSVALGVLVIGERLRTLQWAAVAIAGIGVTGMAVGLGTIPWVSLALAFSFGFYGLLKKRHDAPRPLTSLFGELAVLSVPALAGLLLYDSSGESFGSSFGVTAFIIAAGAMTVVPLLLFGAAARRIPLTMVGLLQYIAPTLQLLLGVLVFNESLSGDKLMGFAAVWIALAIYSYDGYQRSRNRVPASV